MTRGVAILATILAIGIGVAAQGILWNSTRNPLLSNWGSLGGTLLIVGAVAQVMTQRRLTFRDYLLPAVAYAIGVVLIPMIAFQSEWTALAIPLIAVTYTLIGMFFAAFGATLVAAFR